MFCDAPISMGTIAEVFDHSSDCVKLIDPKGSLLWMNKGGLCAMELEDFNLVEGLEWATCWPAETQKVVRATYQQSKPGMSRFTSQCPTAKGTPKWWEVTVVPLDDFDGSLFGYLATSRDVTDREVATRSRDILMEELRHRQGNTLSLASSLMTLHARDRPEVSDFVTEMSTRLAAMGRAQAVMGSKETQYATKTDLANLVRVLIQPLQGPDCAITYAVEPGIGLGPDQVDALSMILSELAVNAAKHGAFRHGGKLRLEGRRTQSGLSFHWSECADATVVAHHRDGGQGQKLMQRIAQIHNGIFSLSWTAGGPHAELTLPLGMTPGVAA